MEFGFPESCAVERWRSPTHAASGAAKRWHQEKAQIMAHAPGTAEAAAGGGAEAVADAAALEG
ncbi:unnamed protein product [Ectocarpus sp. CCAP 1310/34]|nr:unnamed protein product [Ectocarpus sp. CCAP 1310/34]